MLNTSKFDDERIKQDGRKQRKNALPTRCPDAPTPGHACPASTSSHGNRTPRTPSLTPGRLVNGILRLSPLLARRRLPPHRLACLRSPRTPLPARVRSLRKYYCDDP